MSQTYQHWQLEIKEKIAYLALNRPEVKNRMTDVTLHELKEITKFLSGNADVWAVVVKANGEHFSAGVDVSFIGQALGQEKSAFANTLRESQSAFDDFEALDKPTIAVMQGSVIGGGMILAACCDFRIAAENTTFWLPEVKRSIGVIMGTQRLTRLMGLAAVKEMSMLAKLVDAPKAMQLGFLTEICPLAQLEETTANFVQQFYKLPPLAVALCKKIADEGQFLERAGQDLEIEAQAELLNSEDFKEAIASFFEKRKPIYRGK